MRREQIYPAKEIAKAKPKLTKIGFIPFSFFIIIITMDHQNKEKKRSSISNQRKGH
jgi:hypothetical protein